MKFVLYANANEMKLGEDGHISQTDFLCIEEHVHLERKSTWKNGVTEIVWGDPKKCDGICRTWNERNLGMPEETEKGCEEFLKPNDEESAAN